MYRQWRECTKAMISGKPPRYKKHQAITKEYLDFARARLAETPGLAKAYNMNHGIIKMRDDFLSWRGTTGADIIRSEHENGELGDQDVDHNIVLIPAATIGCGKTTIALALVKLFGWGHFQNDNVKTKKGRAQVFAETICSLLATNPVVIADRNNHQKRERDQLITDISKSVRDARFVALHYVHDRFNQDKIRDATRGRVLARGDNHQTIQAGSKDQREIIEIMEGFMHRFQPVDTSETPDSNFDLVIDLDPTVESRENLELVIEKLNNTYPALFKNREMPNDAELDEAIEFAMNYSPDFKMDLSRNGNKQNLPASHNKRQNQTLDTTYPKPKKQPRMEYFSVQLNKSRITSILSALFDGQKATVSRFYNHLQKSRRIQSEFHVTLIHRASSAQNEQYWSQLLALHASTAAVANGNYEPELGRCNVQIERLVFDNRIMCFVVRLSGSATVQLEGEAGTGTENLQFETVNQVAHVTVGTASQDVKPKESNELLQRWLNGGSGEETGIWELPVKGNVVLEGSVRGVLGRM